MTDPTAGGAESTESEDPDAFLDEFLATPKPAPPTSTRTWDWETAWTEPKPTTESKPRGPDWLEEVLATPKPNRATPVVGHRPAISNGDGQTTAYGRRALADEIQILFETPKGGRNDQLNIAGFNLGQLVPTGHINEAELVARLTAVAHSIGLETSEIGPTVRSGVGDGQEHPREAPPLLDRVTEVTDENEIYAHSEDETNFDAEANEAAPAVTVPNENTDDEWSRWVDLRPYLEGTRVLAQPIVGGERDDGIQLLYPKRWHTNIALTGAGKTAFALWHVKAVLDAGGHVAYLHFEEFEPDGVIDRLISFGVDAKRSTSGFTGRTAAGDGLPGEMAYWLTQFEQPPALAMLGRHQRRMLPARLGSERDGGHRYLSGHVRHPAGKGRRGGSVARPPTQGQRPAKRNARLRLHRLARRGGRRRLSDGRLKRAPDGDRRQGSQRAVRRQGSLQPGETVGQPRHHQRSALVVHGRVRRRRHPGVDRRAAQRATQQMRVASRRARKRSWRTT